MQTFSTFAVSLPQATRGSCRGVPGPVRCGLCHPHPSSQSAHGLVLAAPCLQSMLAAYVVSLLMAFAMSIAFEAAQPALLYLVPILLGTFVSMALRQGELMAAWEGSYGQQWTRQTAGEEHALIPDADSSPRGMGAV